MPYVFNPFQQGQQNNDTNQAPNILGDSATLSNVNQSNIGKNQQKQSGSYVNLQKYLDANQGQGEQLANQINNKIDTAVNDTQTKANNLGSEVGTVNQLNSDNLYSQFYNNAGADKSAYNNFKSTGGYSGPTDVNNVQGISDLYSANQNAKNLVDSSKTEEGRQSLLGNVFNRDNYSQGAKQFDNLLLQTSDASKNIFNNTQNKFSTLNDYINGKQTDLQNRINANVQNAQANKALIPQAETEAVNKFKQPIQQRIADYTANQNKQSAIESDLKDGDLNLASDAFQFMGVQPSQQGVQLFDVDPSKYLKTQSVINPTLNNMANADERTKYKSLMDLIGQSNLEIGDKADSAYQAGSFDTQGFNQALADAKARYDASQAPMRFSNLDYNQIQAAAAAYEAEKARQATLAQKYLKLK